MSLAVSRCESFFYIFAGYSGPEHRTTWSFTVLHMARTTEMLPKLVSYRDLLQKMSNFWIVSCFKKKKFDFAWFILFVPAPTLFLLSDGKCKKKGLYWIIASKLQLLLERKAFLWARAMFTLWPCLFSVLIKTFTDTGYFRLWDILNICGLLGETLL